MEKAAKGAAEQYVWPWGNTWIANAANWGGDGDPYETGAEPWTTPVGYFDGSDHGGTFQTTDGSSPYGAHDMAGNVYEWVNDRYGSDYYDAYPVDGWPTDPQGPASGPYRVVRGGGWYEGSGVRLRTALRNYYDLGDRGIGLGFRCARN